MKILILFALLINPSPGLFANELESQNLIGLDKETEALAKGTKIPICSIESMKDNEILPGIESLRLSSRCAKTWPVKTANGVINIPAGLRVVRLSKEIQNEIIFHYKGELYQGQIESLAFEGVPNCKEKEERPNIEAFYEESLYQLTLARDLNPKGNPFFDKTVSDLIKEFQTSPFNQYQFNKLQRLWTKKIEITDKTKVDQIQRLKSLLSSSYDPLNTNGKSIYQTTLIVPLSRSWFESDPELSAFFKKIWVDSKWDIRIIAGGSGEGVSYYPNQSDETNESFLQIKSLLEKTTHFIEKEAKNKNLKNTPESIWLTHLIKSGFSSYERMIFFSPKTWTSNPEVTKWADYVPVDQNLGGIKSNYLLSVMIHEINVNAPNFLTADTHAEENETMALRTCIMKNGIENLKKDPKTIERLFGYNSQIAVLYLKMMMDQFK